MAFMLKNAHRPQAANAQQATILEQWTKVTRDNDAGTGVALPASTTGQLFRVYGGKVIVRALIGTVTTIIQNSDPVMKVSSKQLDNSSVAVGTAVDVASTVDFNSLEVGGTLFVEGDGTALVKANAGAVFIGTNSGLWVAPQGEIYLTTGATKTGKMIWDLWYQPLDSGAYVLPATLTTSLLTAAI